MRDIGRAPSVEELTKCSDMLEDDCDESEKNYLTEQSGARIIYVV